MRFIEPAVSEGIPGLLDAPIDVLDAVNRDKRVARHQLLKHLARRLVAGLTLANMVSVMREVVLVENHAQLHQPLDVMLVRLAPSLDEADEIVLQADALVNPYRAAIARSDIPERAAWNAGQQRDRRDPSLLARQRELIDEIAALCGHLKRLLREAGIFLPHLFFGSREVRVTGSDVPSALSRRQRRAGLGLDGIKILVVLVGDGYALRVQLVARLLPPRVEVEPIVADRELLLGVVQRLGLHRHLVEAALAALGG